MAPRLWATLMGFGLPLLAQFAPLDPGAFQVGPASHPNAKGAVILKDYRTFAGKENYRQIQIRIFHPKGQEAATLVNLDAEDRITYRVTLPDGTQKTYPGAKPVKSLAAKVADLTTENWRFIPEGLTSDCVVDIRLELGTTREIWSEVRNIPLQVGFHTVHRVVDFRGWAPALNATNLGALQWEEVKEPDGKGFRFSVFEVPPREEVPYTASALTQTPSLKARDLEFAYWARGAKDSTQGYWDAFAKHFYKKALEQDLDTGRTYRALFAQLAQASPEDPIGRAEAVVQAIRARVANLHDLGPTQAHFTDLSKRRRWASEDLERALDLGFTDSWGMNVLLYKLLVDFGLKPKLVLLSSRDRWLFNPEYRFSRQFDHTMVLVPGKDGGWFWVDPAWRHFRPGLIPPNYQGTRALMIDPATWTTKVVQVPEQPAETNQVLAHYSHKVEEGRMDYRYELRLLGYPEYRERAVYVDSSPKERERWLSEVVQTRTGGTIKTSRIHDAEDSAKPFWIEFEGTRDLEEGRQVVLNPFPALRNPLPAPETWPKDRFAPIVLPHTQVFRAKAFMDVPKGWELAEPPQLNLKSPYGSVVWTASQLGPGAPVEVFLEVRVDHALATLDGYSELRRFIEGVREAFSHAVILRPPQALSAGTP